METLGSITHATIVLACSSFSLFVVFMSEFEFIVRKMHAYFKKHGHRMVILVFDAARFENSEANRKIYDELLITPRRKLRLSSRDKVGRRDRFRPSLSVCVR